MKEAQFNYAYPLLREIKRLQRYLKDEINEPGIAKIAREIQTGFKEGLEYDSKYHIEIPKEIIDKFVGEVQRFVEARIKRLEAEFEAL